MLREESESDSSLRAQHGAKWSRTPSDRLTGTFTANATKYRTIINNATQADSMVKEKLTTHMAGMQVEKKVCISLNNWTKLSGFVWRGVCSGCPASSGIFRQWRFEHQQVSSQSKA